MSCEMKSSLRCCGPSLRSIHLTMRLRSSLILVDDLLKEDQQLIPVLREEKSWLIPMADSPLMVAVHFQAKTRPKLTAVVPIWQEPLQRTSFGVALLNDAR